MRRALMILEKVTSSCKPARISLFLVKLVPTPYQPPSPDPETNRGTGTGMEKVGGGVEVRAIFLLLFEYNYAFMFRQFTQLYR